MNAPLVAAKGLYKHFGAVVAADSVTVEIAHGETVGIIGANGAGKTTLLRTVVGLLRAQAGEIRFAGRDITGLPPTPELA